MRSHILGYLTVAALCATGLAPATAAARTRHPGAAAQAVYNIVDLGTLGGSSSQANGINNRGWITGFSNLHGDKISRATLWVNGRKIDLGTLGGPNSYVSWPVKSNSQIAGAADVAQSDPFAETFCGDAYLCLAFRWKNFTMTPLPTLGGNNGQATGVNNRGQVVGSAESSVQDMSCAAPQVFDYYAVIWQPNGKILTLPPIAGDTLSQAVAVNNAGNVVGASGPCGPPLNPTYATHAVLWQTGAAVDLGNLGGTIDNAAAAINDRGQIVGLSGLPGNTTYHAFVWQNGLMTDLGTLPGDVNSVAFGLNNRGQVIGQSCDAAANCRAFLWQKGSMTDLNLLVPPHSRLYLTYGGDVNDDGQIVGAGVDTKTGKTPAFLLLPSGKSAVPSRAASARKVILPESVRMQLRQHAGPFRFRSGP